MKWKPYPSFNNLLDLWWLTAALFPPALWRYAREKNWPFPFRSTWLLMSALAPFAQSSRFLPISLASPPPPPSRSQSRQTQRSWALEAESPQWEEGVCSLLYWREPQVVEEEGPCLQWAAWTHPLKLTAATATTAVSLKAKHVPFKSL